MPGLRSSSSSIIVVVLVIETISNLIRRVIL